MSTVASVYKNVRGLRTAIRDVGRLRQIATVLARHGFGHLIHRMQIAEIAGLHGVTDPKDGAAPPETLAHRMRLAVEELGPSFVKLGQILSTRSDLLGAELAAELQGLQDDVPPMPAGDVRDQIEAALGHPLEHLFAHFEPAPLASASIAQVHRAELEDGTEVVVKVRRRGIRDVIERDLSIVHFMAARAEALIPELRLVEPVGIVRALERGLAKELDFDSERQNIERFKKNFADFEGVRIPRVYPELCSEAVLTMERLDGVKITRAVDELGIDPYELAPLMLRVLFKMIFEDGFFHGDLHPGNILIDRELTIGLIDFGLVGRLLPRQREDVLDLFVGIAKEDYEIVARSLFDMGVRVRGVEYDYAAFEADVIDLLEQHLAGKRLSDVDMQALFAELVSGAIRHQIKMPPTYTLVFKALMTVEGIGKSLAPNVNIVDEARPFVRQMLVQRYSPERLLRETVDTFTATSRFFRRFARVAPRVLRDMEQGQLAVRIEARQLDELVASQKQSSRRLARAIVFAAGLIVAALAYAAPGPALLGMNVGAVAALAAAALTGVPLLFNLLRGR